MKICFFFILRSILGPFFLMLGLLSLIASAHQLMFLDRTGTMIIAAGFIKFLFLYLYILPYCISVVCQIAMFFGLALTISHMQQKGEFIAFKYLGISHIKIFLPILFFSIICTICCYVLSIYVGPYAHKTAVSKQFEYEEKMLLSMLQKQKFNNFNELSIYFEDIDSSGIAHNILICRKGNNEVVIIKADSLQFIKSANNTTVINLSSVTEYKMPSNKSQNSIIAKSKMATLPLRDLFSLQKKSRFFSGPMHTVGIKELYLRGKKEKNNALINEFHFRILRPLYCMITAIYVYAIFAGINTNRSSNKYQMAKYVLHFAVIIFFGVECDKFISIKYWYLRYIVAAFFIIYNMHKIIKLDKP